MIRKIGRITNKLDLYFGEDTKKDVEYNNFIISEDECVCIDFTLDDNDILGINNINKCKFSGSELLDIIDLIALDQKLKIVYLDDQSSITFGEYSLDFGVLSILTKGQSWYNSKGYYQENFNEEKKKWNLIRNSTIEQMFDYIMTIDYETYKSKYKGWFDDGLLSFSSLNSPILDKDNYLQNLESCIIYLSSIFDLNETVKDFCIRLTLLSKTNSSTDDDCYDYFLMLSLFSHGVTYTRFPLRKTFD